MKEKPTGKLNARLYTVLANSTIPS